MDHCCICLVACGDSTSNSSRDISEILDVFLQCYNNNSDLALLTAQETKDLNVCPKCSSHLIKLGQINREISQLQSEAAHVKSTLTARILGPCMSFNRPVQFSRNSGLICELNQIKSRIFNEYSCHVQLSRLEELEIPPEYSEYCAGSPPESCDIDNDSTYIDVDVDIDQFVDLTSEYSECSQPEKNQDLEDNNSNFLAIEIGEEHVGENFKTSNKKNSKKSSRKIGPKSRKKIYAPDAALIRIIPPARSQFLIDGFEISEATDGMFYCAHCGSKRAKKNYMVDHVRQDHAPTSKFLCRHSVVMDLGDGRYSRGSSVVETSGDRVVCLTCQVTFSDLPRAIYHVNKEHFQEIIPEFMPTPAERKKVIQANETGNNQFEYLGRPFQFDEPSKKFSCGICGALRTRKREIGVHMRQAHYNEDGYEPLPEAKSVMCDECGKTFQKASRLETHVMAAHRGPQFKCDHCGQLFKWIGSLRKHEIAAHRDDADKFMCGFCGRTFKFTNELTLHERHHTQDGFPCGICEQIFTTYWNFRRHRRKVHGEVKFARVVLPSHKKPKSKSKLKKSTSDFEDLPEQLRNYFCEIPGQI